MTPAEQACKLLPWARSQAACCRLCPRRCGVDRAAGQRGRCGAGATADVWLDFVHYGEEDELAPSHTVYLDGCNLSCRFCHTDAERRRGRSHPLDPAAWRRLLARGRPEQPRTLNLLGGEPTVNLPALIELWADPASSPDPRDPPPPPLVWNTNAYAEPDAWAHIGDLADIVLADLKFADPACAAAIADAPDLVDVARANLVATRSGGKARLIVRHLVLPGHWECCTRPTLDWLAARLSGTPVSLTDDYLPMPAVRGDPRLGRFPEAGEIARARRYAQALGIPLAALTPGGKTAPASPPAPISPPADRRRAVETELVIRPDGTVYLRHPLKELLQLEALTPSSGQAVPATAAATQPATTPPADR